MKNITYDVVGGASAVTRICETCSELGQGIQRRFSGRAGPGSGLGRVTWKEF